MDTPVPVGVPDAVAATEDDTVADAEAPAACDGAAVVDGDGDAEAAAGANVMPLRGAELAERATGSVRAHSTGRHD